MKALQQVGGIGPELAEDFSTTVALNAGGWKGVWSYDAKAHGDGPQTFADLLIQDYQWSRSMAILLLTYFPKKWIKLPWRPKVQMAFAELWYPFGATAWLASIVLAPLAIITGHAPVRVDFGTFGGLVVVPYLLTLGLYAYTRSQGHLRPERLKVVSWENALFELARWYWVLKAEVDALTVVLFRRKLEFRVTPKEVASGIVGVPNKILVPFAVIAVGNLVAVTLYRGEPEVVGYVGFALVSALAYMLLVGLVLGLQAWEQRGRRIQALVRYLPQFAFAGSLWVWLVLLLGMGSLMSVHKPVPQGAPETSVVLGENTQIRDNDIAVVEEYTVREGDSLWNIAQTRYGRGQDYTKIQRARTGVLRTGEVLTFSQ